MQRGKQNRILALAAAIVAAVIFGAFILPPIEVLALPLASPATPVRSTMPNMAGMQTQGTTVSSVSSGSWSDPTVWDKGVPIAGENVVISPGNTITYNLQSSPVLGSVLVQGSLIFSRTLSTDLAFQNMTVDMPGYVEVGTTNNPIPQSITTTLQLSAVTEGSAKIMVMGHLEIHGSPLVPTWTRLAETVQPGATTLSLTSPVDWKVGDNIVIASTSLNPSESERDMVAAVSGNLLTLAQPLKYEHDGTAPTQAEVEDLTRNVVVTSYNTQIHATGVMFMYGAMGGISYAEFSHLGGKGILGDYPIHFHHVQNSMDGTIVNGVSVWDSHNRFLTIHNTDGITVENSVGYQSIGHGFFLEDGTEENNTLVNNIAILTLPGRIRPDDGSPAGFWIQNPRNNLTGNVAVSAGGSGFDFALPDNAPQVIPFTEGNFQASLNQATVPRMHKIQAFVNNEAHSNRGDGIHLYRLNPLRHGTISWFKGMSLWRNNVVGGDITASQANVTSSTFFGNRNGNLRIDANDFTVSSSQFMGELDSIQTATSTKRFATSPFGVVLSGTRVTISNSLFKGHLPQGLMASADIINSPRDFQQATVTLQNDKLQSPHTIIFGYPLNGLSYFNVVNLNGDASQTFTLLRYDLGSTPSSSQPSTSRISLPSQCTVDDTYMALKCPLLPPSFWKGLHP